MNRISFAIFFILAGAFESCSFDYDYSDSYLQQKCDEANENVFWRYGEGKWEFMYNCSADGQTCLNGRCVGASKEVDSDQTEESEEAFDGCVADDFKCDDYGTTLLRCNYAQVWTIYYDCSKAGMKCVEAQCVSDDWEPETEENAAEPDEELSSGDEDGTDFVVEDEDGTETDEEIDASAMCLNDTYCFAFQYCLIGEGASWGVCAPKCVYNEDCPEGSYCRKDSKCGEADCECEKGCPNDAQYCDKESCKCLYYSCPNCQYKNCCDYSTGICDSPCVCKNPSMCDISKGNECCPGYRCRSILGDGFGYCF